MNYVWWAVVGMVGYSLTTFFVKLATRGGQLSSYLVLAVATVIVAASALTIVVATGDFTRAAAKELQSVNGLYAIATGVALTVAVSSLFRALSLGPASVVVPVYGMFIAGGAVLGMAFLGEPVTLRKIIGLGLAVLSIVFIAGARPN